MKFRDIAFMMRTAAQVARAGEDLVSSLDRSQRYSLLIPVFLGIGLGVGIGALIFDQATRKRLMEWTTGAVASHGTNGAGVVKATVAAAPAAPPS
jgi:hypothetical protein